MCVCVCAWVRVREKKRKKEIKKETKQTRTQQTIIFILMSAFDLAVPLLAGMVCHLCEVYFEKCFFGISYSGQFLVKVSWTFSCSSHNSIFSGLDCYLCMYRFILFGIPRTFFF